MRRRRLMSCGWGGGSVRRMPTSGVDHDSGGFHPREQRDLRVPRFDRQRAPRTRGGTRPRRRRSTSCVGRSRLMPPRSASRSRRSPPISRRRTSGSSAAPRSISAWTLGYVEPGATADRRALEAGRGRRAGRVEVDRPQQRRAFLVGQGGSRRPRRAGSGASARVRRAGIASRPGRTTRGRVRRRARRTRRRRRSRSGRDSRSRVVRRGTPGRGPWNPVDRS